MSNTYADILGNHGGDHQDTVFRLSTPKMETKGTSETLVPIYQTIRRHIAVTVILRISHNTVLEWEEMQQMTEQSCIYTATGPKEQLSLANYCYNLCNRNGFTEQVEAGGNGRCIRPSPQFLHTNDKVVTHVRPRPLPSTSLST